MATLTCVFFLKSGELGSGGSGMSGGGGGRSTRTDLVGGLYAIVRDF
jgi:hypothetical protein